MRGFVSGYLTRLSGLRSKSTQRMRFKLTAGLVPLTTPLVGLRDFLKSFVPCGLIGRSKERIP